MAALPRWRATERRWIRNIRSRDSCVCAVILPPTSSKRSRAALHIGPSDSMATGTKWWVRVRDSYTSLSYVQLPPPQLTPRCEQTAEDKTEPACLPRWCPMSETCLLSSVIPSGRFWSTRSSVLGPFIAGIPALAKALQRTSLRRLWRINLPGPTLQERQWRPRTSTREPQVHWGGSQILKPKTKANANAHRLIIEAQPAGRYWQDIEPIPSMFGCYRQQTSSILRVPGPCLKNSSSLEGAAWPSSFVEWRTHPQVG